jgi:hypothetical protein
MKAEKFDELLKQNKGKIFILIICKDDIVKSSLRKVINDHITIFGKRLHINLDFIKIVNLRQDKQAPLIVINENGSLVAAWVIVNSLELGEYRERKSILY